MNKAVKALSGFYCNPADESDYLLKQLNRVWKQWASDLPVSIGAKSYCGFPEGFETLEQFSATIPTINRKQLAQRLDEFTITTPVPNAARVTGGSTAEPIRIPAWRDEFKTVAASQWLGRAWQGVLPTDRLFMLWGHSHLLGDGLRGRVNAFTRQFKDTLLGYCRVSAYDLSEVALRRAADQLIHFKPAFIYGYSVALDQFARVNADRSDEFRQLNLKCVQATAERFPSDESPELVEKVFGCPVVMEYGAMESGHIAVTAPDGQGYRVYWKDYLVEGIKQADDSHKIVLTSLYPRATPLIRYELGDSIRLRDEVADQDHVIGIKEFLDVGGRCNYGVSLSDGTFFHSEVFTHCIREIQLIEAFQITQDHDELSVTYLAQAEIDEAEKNAALSRFSRVDARLGQIEFKRVEALQKSVSGKTPMIVSS